METTTLVSSISNNHFFSVCHYITTLRIIFNNNKLISSAVKSETVPVVNAFFEYLNMSTNESVAKIHLFEEIRNKTDISGFKMLNNFQDANRFYKYIINVALFAPHGNITGNVRNILRNNTNKNFSNLQKILFHNFSKNFIVKNVCSLRKEYGNLNILAIKRTFAEYVLPIFTEIWNAEKNLKSIQMNDLKIVKRFRRQESSSEDSDSNALVIDEDSPEEEDQIRNNLSPDRWFNVRNTIEHRELSNTRYSRRMDAIKTAAKFISSNVPTRTFTEAVNMLKSYILSVDDDNSNLLTYAQLAKNYRNYMTIMDFYSLWMIDNNKYINDVLYESKFYFPHACGQCYLELMTLLNVRTSSIFSYYYGTYITHLDILQRKIRFEDYFRICYELNETQELRFTSHLEVALLRVALRQCDEEFNEDPIVCVCVCI
ncbi:uncharacterized protein LOC122499563 isoform X1 [Leptopilina heterotoma]|uniref:uncharacterized protein LOC122499563 isoform X1 n=1 Tax=Leptopilina heterotoma TaxID=63436 RepID=UPI001CAA14A2|nr:uncharacterized protein LOC122499563 isoform X1 [Leptopilina heterotoma]